MDRAFWAGPDRVKVKEGTLRLLSAREVLEARREGDALAQDGRERALCRNACLIAKALERVGKPVFESGQEALDSLRVEDIARLADAWAAFNRECNPSPMDGEEEISRRKKAWSTRVMSAFSGACSVCLALCPPKIGQNR
ncbi:MAG: hypothetical protein K2O11_04965 [Oscillospiraceae bacterium]|nr:hypothetical protein [Oscillospiraceae bacterium]